MKNTFLIVAIGSLVAAFWYFYTPEKVTEGELTVRVVETTEVESATNFEISLEATTISAYASVLTIRTNIPLPIEVMASVSIKDQKPTDTYIGVSKRVRLISPEQTVTLDGESENLPAGDYIAEVTFYPRWGVRDQRLWVQIG